MGGATLQCGSFEGNDKSASPIVSVMEEAFTLAFAQKPRGRMRRRIATLIGESLRDDLSSVEAAILEVKFNEAGVVMPAVVSILLPFFENYQARLLSESGIPDDLDVIWERMSHKTKAKYGSVLDPGWHLYCLHDLIPACRVSIAEQLPIQVLW